MLLVQKLPNGVIEVKPEGKLQESDFRALTPQIDGWMKLQENLRVLVDATAFEGWVDSQAADAHFRFVRAHHEKIERVALIAGHAWQHWLAMFASHFAHPEFKIFDANGRAQAEAWLLEPLRKAC